MDATTTPREPARVPQHALAARDPAGELLHARELRALGAMTVARLCIIGLMAPLVWVLGSNRFDKVTTSAVLAVYVVIVLAAGWQSLRRRHLLLAGLVGVGLDVAIVATLPVIWYFSLGGTDLPVGFTLKTSVTVMALLMITLNALAMRPLYPALVTAGALIVHASLLLAALADPHTEFTSSYLIAYTTPGVATGRVATGFIIVALVGALLTFLTATARRMIVEAAELQKANVQLGRYFSPNLVAKLVDNPALLHVGGERRELSFVFTDLEGFTSLVEKHEPAVTVPLLNGYLDALVQAAFRHEGTVDKIVGDAVHVIFGAPGEQPDHAARAVACALEMDAVAERYREKVRPLAELGVTRIGVNSGPATVGNFGGDALFDYTAHGEAINAAARLEGANKYLGTRICVSGATAAQVPGFVGRPIGILSLAGVEQGLEAFEPVTGARAQAGRIAAYREAYDAMARGAPDAAARFDALCERFPDDALAALHRERLRSGESGTAIALAGK